MSDCSSWEEWAERSWQHYPSNSPNMGEGRAEIEIRGSELPHYAQWAVEEKRIELPSGTYIIIHWQGRLHWSANRCVVTIYLGRCLDPHQIRKLDLHLKEDS